MAALAILVKASLLLVAAATAHALVGRRMSAAVRHQFWTLAAASLLLLPILTLVLPSWKAIRLAAPAPVSAPIAESSAPDLDIAAATPMASISSSMPDDNSTPPTPWIGGIPWPAALAALYVAGVLLLLTRFGLQLLVLSRLSRGAAPAGEEWERLLAECAQQLGVRRPVRFIRSLDRTIPMAFGAVKAAILIPAIGDSWSPDRRRAVLLHELAHVGRHDCLAQMLATVVCAVYWVHPGAWWMARRLRVERELACDDLVLSAGTSPRDYAGHLLEIAYALRTTFAPTLSVSMASPRQLEGRMLALLDSARNRATPTLRTRLTVTLLMMALLVPVAAATVTSAPAAPAVVVDAPLVAADAPNPPAVPGAPAQTTTPSNRQARTGTWEIRPVQESGSVHLRMREGDGFYGTNIEIERLNGLASSMLTGSHGSAGFSVRHDAGTFTFVGIFRNGVGSGTYTFTPNTGFADVMVTRGYERPAADQLRALARLDVGMAFLDELTSQGYRRPTLAQIVRATEHGVHTSFLRDMGRLGYRAGSVDALIDMRDHGVSPQYIRGLAAEGLPRLSAEELIYARDHGVSPEYIRDLAQLGIPLQSVERLVYARDHGISPEYVREMRDQGYVLPIDGLVRARDHGVSSEYAREMRNQGYTLTIEELIRARDHGVSVEFVRDLRRLVR
jgi:beta-lactamase regulating signal transducer with metallopeptidase domain